MLYVLTNACSSFRAAAVAAAAAILKAVWTSQGIPEDSTFVPLSPTCCACGCGPGERRPSPPVRPPCAAAPLPASGPCPAAAHRCPRRAYCCCFCGMFESAVTLFAVVFLAAHKASTAKSSGLRARIGAEQGKLLAVWYVSKLG